MISITINPVNDAPVLSTIGSQSFNEDQNLSIPISYSDSDGDELSVSVVSSDNNITVSIDEDYTEAMLEHALIL